MIKRFGVENFQSIKDKVDISFVASSLTDETSYNNYFLFHDANILKASSFYGMNASGKSTIVRAMAVLKELVAINTYPINFQQLYRQNLPYYPFKFSDETKKSPTNLEIEFSLNNNDNSPIYIYKVSYTANFVIEERLDKKISQKPSLVFLRKTNNSGKTDIGFGVKVSNTTLLEALKGSLLPNKTFLSLFSSFAVDDLTDAYKFFSDRMINISPEVTRFDDIMPNRIETDVAFGQFILKLLKAADFNIGDFHVGKSRIRNMFSPVPGVVAEKKTLFLDHDVNYPEKSIEFIQESLGTKKIIIIGSHLYDALIKPSVLIIDELEASLHPDLTKLIITLFLDETVNVHNSQLIFTSHETTLLDLSLLRRDQINFVYKDKETCGTFVRSLKDFQMRKDSSISKSYLAGRFSTSPDINENILVGE